MRLLLLLFISCGEYGSSNRCFTMEEARLYCQVDQIKNNIIKEQAAINCAAKYPIEGCYYLD